MTEGRRTDGARASGYATTLLAGLASAGAVAIGVSRPWVEATAAVHGLPTIRAQADGSELAPLAGALGVVLLAAFGAVVATRGWVRRAVGAFVAVAALVVLVYALSPPDAAATVRAGLAAKGWPGGDVDTSTRPWRWLALAGAVGCLVSGLAVVRLGARWPTMGGRYDVETAPAERRHADAPDAGATTSATDGEQLSEADVWRAIDRGNDPTQRP